MKDLEVLSYKLILIELLMHLYEKKLHDMIYENPSVKGSMKKKENCSFWDGDVFGFNPGFES